MSIHGYGVTPEFLARLIDEIVRGRAPEKTTLLAKVASSSLNPKEREELRGVLALEFTEHGLAPDDEPNERGRLIEAAINWLGRR